MARNKSRLRRRLLALRREDARINRLAGQDCRISVALMELSFRVPWRQQWFPPIKGGALYGA